MNPPVSPPAIFISQAQANVNDEVVSTANREFRADMPSLTPSCDPPHSLPSSAIAAETFPRLSVAEPARATPVVSPPVPAVSEIPSMRPTTVQTSVVSTPPPQKRFEQPVLQQDIHANMPGFACASDTARPASKPGSARGGVIGLGIAGALLGSLIGFMMRPSVFGMQMPLTDVLTLGSNLHGMFLVDVKGLCVTSFCYLIGGAVAGAAIGALSAVALLNLMRNSAKASAS